MRVLAIDPAVRNTGYAVLEGEARHPKVLTFDVISIPGKLPQSAALSAIRTHLVNIIQTYQPDEVAVEVLKRVDGVSTVAVIVDDLAASFNAPREEIESDVLGMLEDLSRKGALSA